jgi:hypothetical protein
MGAACGLRQITEAEAAAYLREPAYFIQVERARHEEFSKYYHVGFDFDEWNKAHKQRSYDWIVLVKGLVSFSKVSHSLIVYGGQPIKGFKVEDEAWLSGEARVLSPEQVLAIHQVLAPVLVNWGNEDFSGQTEMFEDFQSFLKESTEFGKALLVLVGP